VKKKGLLLGLFTALMLFQIIQFSRSYHNPTPFCSGEDFNIECNTNQKIGFDGDIIIELEVKQGILNATSGYIRLYNDRGDFRFDAINTTTLSITSPDPQQGFEVSVTGSDFNYIGAFLWNVYVESGDYVTIIWRFRIESWIGNYTMFAIGMGGLIIMVASPTWGIWVIRKKGLDADSIERLAYAMLLFCVGFGLLVMWLFST